MTAVDGAWTVVLVDPWSVHRGAVRGQIMVLRQREETQRQELEPRDPEPVSCSDRGFRQMCYRTEVS